MATYPFKVSGACASVAKNVFRVTFSQPLSSVPNMRCYDNSAAFPNTDNSTGTTFVIFKGSTGFASPMLAYIDTKRGGPAASNWSDSAIQSAGVATVLMAGDASYLLWRYSAASMDVAGGATLTWNSLCITPHNVNPTMSRHHNVAIRYTYTSTIPTVWFHANNEHEGGTEAVPVWGTITPDSQGVRHGSATATNTSILANIPLISTASTEITRTAWVADS